MTRLVSVRSALLVLVAAPGLALAHTGATPHVHNAAEALAAGFAHPFTGFDHLAAMVALGLWSALATKRIWVAPVAFASALLIGALLGLAGFALPAIEPMIDASVLVLGLLVATNARLPVAAGALLAAGFALFHGVAHGAELAGPQTAWSLIGMVSATALLHGAGLAAGKLLQQRSVWAPRVAGAAVALFGASLLIA
jgi:urease accessory protein